MIKYTKIHQRFTGAGLDKPGPPHDQVRTTPVKVSSGIVFR